MAKKINKQSAIPKNTTHSDTEGADFYIENGLYVFTEKFLLQRGYCCQNGCRHCPYGFKKDKTL